MAESFDDMMKRSVQQGMDYLVDIQNADILHKKEAIFNIENLFGTSVLFASNEEAKGLEKAIDRNIDLSGAAHDLALKQVFERAAIGFHAQTLYVDEKGARHQATGDIPERAKHVILTF